MTKTKKFNFDNTPATQEINEQMNEVQQASMQPTAQKDKPSRTSGTSWTLMQARVPKELHRQISMYCAAHDVKKGDFVAKALQQYLDSLNVNAP